MKVQVHRIDENGFYLEPVIFDEVQVRQHDAGIITLDDDIITNPVPEGIYRPKWNGTQWIEGLTQQEIDELKHQSVPADPRDEKISQLESNLVIMQETINYLLGL